MLNKIYFKKIRYLIEASLAWLGLVFFGSLSLKNASNFSAFFAEIYRH